MAVVPATSGDRIDYIVAIMRRGEWNAQARSECMERWACTRTIVDEAAHMASRVVRAIVREDGFVEGITSGYLIETVGAPDLEPKDRLRAAELLLKYFPPKLEGSDEEYAAQCKAEFNKLIKEDEE